MLPVEAQALALAPTMLAWLNAAVIATVTVYQKAERAGMGEVLTDQVKASGTTDLEGLFPLPNVAIDSTLVPTTYAGDKLRDNPFRAISRSSGETAICSSRSSTMGTWTSRGSTSPK